MEPKIGSASWSNLPADMLILIIERLRYIDQIRFRAVCKSWRSDKYKVKCENKLPWVMSWDWPIDYEGSYASLRKEEDGSITTWCDLYDPIRKQKQTVVENNKDGAIFVGAKFCAAKDGWVLFSRREDFDTCKTTSLFFYNPFNKKIIRLARSYLKVTGASFTNTPDSPDCLIFTYSRYSKTKTSIGIYSPSKRTWKRLYFDGYDGKIQNLVFIEGVFYCAFRFSVMGSFNVETQEWKTYPYLEGMISEPYHGGEKYLTDFDGKVLLAFMAMDEQIWHLYLFDDQSKKSNYWCEMDSLSNGLLFFALCNNSVLVPVAEETCDLRNTLHKVASYGCESVFYEDQSNQSCRQLYGWLGTDKYLNKLWIFPSK